MGLRTARGDMLIGPDNGLLIGASEALGGISEARALANRDLMLPVISASFHGRDIFAPVAGHLAAGVEFEAVGPTVAIDNWCVAGCPADHRGRRPRAPRSSTCSSTATSPLPARRRTSRRPSGRWSPVASSCRIPRARGRPGGRGTNRLGKHVRPRAGRLVAVDGPFGGPPVARRQPGRRGPAARPATDRPVRIRPA